MFCDPWLTSFTKRAEQFRSCIYPIINMRKFNIYIYGIKKNT